jgi:hypothetical protein
MVESVFGLEYIVEYYKGSASGFRSAAFSDLTNAAVLAEYVV